MVDACLANSSPVPEHLREEYRREGAGVMEIDRERLKELGVTLYLAPLLSNRSEYARHDPALLAKAIIDIWNQKNPRRSLR